MSDKPNILSVDDEVLNQEIILELLEGDFNVIALSSGQECLDRVVEKLPELILLDVNMPGINGLETCKCLRKSEKYKDIPIILVSALASSQEIALGIQAGANDYLTKPFNEEELYTKINVLLNNR